MNFVLVDSPTSEIMPTAGPTVGPTAGPIVAPAVERVAHCAAAPVEAAPNAVAAPKVSRPRQRNKRWSERVEIQRQGVISIERDAEVHTFGCELRDISTYGAKIELDADIDDDIADTFVLVFYANRVRSEARCILKWRSGATIGVSFAGRVRTSVARDEN